MGPMGWNSVFFSNSKHPILMKWHGRQAFVSGKTDKNHPVLPTRMEGERPRQRGMHKQFGCHRGFPCVRRCVRLRNGVVHEMRCIESEVTRTYLSSVRDCCVP